MAKLGKVVYLTEAQKETLFSEGTVTVDGTTVTYSANDLYLTPTDNKVNKSGDTMTGRLDISMSSPRVRFLTTNGDIKAGVWFNESSHCLELLSHASNSTTASRKYASFRLPRIDDISIDNNSDYVYHILTDKNTITVAQGGTGATTAAAARTNLGITPANIGAVEYKALSSGYDLDNLMTAGLYYAGGTPVHAPQNAVNGFVLVIGNGSAFKQVWFRLGTIGTNDYRTYIRTHNSDGWGDWYQVITSMGGSITGGNLTFDAGVNYRGINLYGASGAPKISLYNTGARLTIDQYANGSTGGERYLLPTVDTQSSDVWYSILTTKPGDQFCYKAGDTYSSSNGMPVACVLTSSGKTLYLTIPTQKDMRHITSIAVTSLKGGIRHVAGGYLGSGSASTPWTSGDTIELVGKSGLTITAAKISDCLIRITMTSTTAFTQGTTTTAITNNTPLNGLISWTLTFA